MSDTHEAIDKVKKLLALAHDSQSEESRNAAMTAIALMREHKMVLVPQAEIDRVTKVIGESQALAKKYEGETNQKMMLSALAGFMAAKKGLL